MPAPTNEDLGMEVEVRPFAACDQVSARQLVLSGLAERWGVLDPSLNVDLDDIASSYADDVFVVAVHADRVVGTGGLRIGVDDAEVVRMTVAHDCRRRGVGRHILDALVRDARRRALGRLCVETTATWSDARSFYGAYGFRFIGIVASPFGDDARYEMEIDEHDRDRDDPGGPDRMSGRPRLLP